MLELSPLHILLLMFLGASEPTELPIIPPETTLAYLPLDCELAGFADVRDTGAGVAALLDRWRAEDSLTIAPDVLGGLLHMDQLREAVSAQSVSLLALDPLNDLDVISGCFRWDNDSTFPTPEFLLILQGEGIHDSTRPVASSLYLSPITHPTMGTTVYYGSVEGLALAVASPAEDVIALGSQSIVERVLLGAVGGEEPSDAFKALDSADLTTVRWALAYSPSFITKVGGLGFVPYSVGQLQLVLQSVVATGGDGTLAIEVNATTTEAQTRFGLLLDWMGAWSQAYALTVSGMTSYFLGLVYAEDPIYTPQTQLLAAGRDSLIPLLARSGLHVAPSVTRTAAAAPYSERIEITSDDNNYLLLLRQTVLVLYLLDSGNLPELVDALYGTVRWWEQNFGGGDPWEY